MRTDCPVSAKPKPRLDAERIERLVKRANEIRDQRRARRAALDESIDPATPSPPGPWGHQIRPGGTGDGDSLDEAINLATGGRGCRGCGG